MNNTTLDNSTSNGNNSFPTFPKLPIDGQFLERLLQMHYEYRLAQSLNKYGYITEVAVGSVANLLTLVVVLGLTRLPICNYMAALALADLSVLMGPCLTRWLLTTGHDPRADSHINCKGLNFQFYWSFSVSAWILVAMTIDRFVAITFPLKAIKWSTPQRARYGILVVFVTMFIVNFHIFFTMELKTDDMIHENLCLPEKDSEDFINDVWPWIDATIYSFLPFFLLLIFNFLIIFHHHKATRRASSLKGHGEFSRSTNRINAKLTVTLLFVSFAFITLTAPRVLLMIIRPHVFDFVSNPGVIQLQKLARYTLTSSIVNVLMFSNHCINFFLYCLTGNKFRKQLVKVFTMCKNRKLRRVMTSSVLPSHSTDMKMSSSRRRTSSTSSVMSAEANDMYKSKDKDLQQSVVISEKNGVVPVKSALTVNNNKSTETELSTIAEETDNL